MRLLFLTALVGGLLSFWSGRALAEDARDILVIANKSLAAEKITLDEVKDLFLKKRTQLDNGKNIVAISARPGSLLRQQFAISVLGMTEGAETTLWQNRKLKTGDTPPPEFSDTLKAVFKLKNGVGYAFRGEMKGDVVDILAVIPYTPAPAKAAAP